MRLYAEQRKCDGERCLGRYALQIQIECSVDVRLRCDAIRWGTVRCDAERSDGTGLGWIGLELNAYYWNYPADCASPDYGHFWTTAASIHMGGLHNRWR